MRQTILITTIIMLFGALGSSFAQNKSKEYHVTGKIIQNNNNKLLINGVAVHYASGSNLMAQEKITGYIMISNYRNESVQGTIFNGNIRETATLAGQGALLGDYNSYDNYWNNVYSYSGKTKRTNKSGQQFSIHKFIRTAEAFEFSKEYKGGKLTELARADLNYERDGYRRISLTYSPTQHLYFLQLTNEGTKTGDPVSWFYIPFDSYTADALIYSFAAALSLNDSHFSPDSTATLFNTGLPVNINAVQLNHRIHNFFCEFNATYYNTSSNMRLLVLYLRSKNVYFYLGVKTTEILPLYNAMLKAKKQIKKATLQHENIWKPTLKIQEINNNKTSAEKPNKQINLEKEIKPEQPTNTIDTRKFSKGDAVILILANGMEFTGIINSIDNATIELNRSGNLISFTNNAISKIKTQ